MMIRMIHRQLLLPQPPNKPLSQPITFTSFMSLYYILCQIYFSVIDFGLVFTKKMVYNKIEKHCRNNSSADRRYYENPTDSCHMGL